METQLDNPETEVKKLLIKVAGPAFIEKWLKQPCPIFGNITPKEMFEQGRGEEVLNKLKSVYKEKERHEMRIADPEAP